MKIREEFSKHKAITDPQEINSLLKVAQESEELLRTKVVQLSQVRKDVYRKCVYRVEVMFVCNGDSELMYMVSFNTNYRIQNGTSSRKVLQT